MRASGPIVGIAIRTAVTGTSPLTVAQHRVLVLLEDGEARSVGAVAERLGIDQSNASRHCSRLSQLGLVTRTRSEADGRAVEVRLTAAGHRQVGVVYAARRRAFREVLARLPRDQLAVATEVFEGFARAAESSLGLDASA